MKRKENPTIEESKLATEMQSPIRHDASQAPVRAIDEAQHETKAVSKVSTFQQLAKFSRNARLNFGGTSQWAQPEQLFNPSYENGIISVPFYITKAFSFISKKFNVPRLGIEIVLSDGQMRLVALGLNPNDIKRNEMVAMYNDKDGKPLQGVPPIGPFVLAKLPTLKGNDYYDLQPYEIASQSDEISFVVIDEDLPF